MGVGNVCFQADVYDNTTVITGAIDNSSLDFDILDLNK